MAPADLRGLLELPNVRKSAFFEAEGDGLRCSLCERRCRIAEGRWGYCGTRVNVGGELYTVVYGDLSAIESRPIEIKPFYHYWPSSTSTTISTFSCTFSCPWCQNFHLSQVKPNPFSASYFPLEEVIAFAEAWGDEGISVSFQEPTLLTDYAIDLFRLASERGLYSCYVSNGYMTLEALEALKEAGLTGLKIDVKGGRGTYERVLGVNPDVPWRNARKALEMGLHVEIVNLVVTGVNEREVDEVIDRHVRELGLDVPIHFNRYFPAYKYHAPPTKIEVLIDAYRKARERGIHYVYVGNVDLPEYGHTYCPGCNRAVIERVGYGVAGCRVRDGRCAYCGYKLNITGRIVRKSRLFW